MKNYKSRDNNVGFRISASEWQDIAKIILFKISAKSRLN